jgi:hypothetical protein
MCKSALVSFTTFVEVIDSLSGIAKSCGDLVKIELSESPSNFHDYLQFVVLYGLFSFCSYDQKVFMFQLWTYPFGKTPLRNNGKLQRTDENQYLYQCPIHWPSTLNFLFLENYRCDVLSMLIHHAGQLIEKKRNTFEGEKITLFRKSCIQC